MAKEWKNSNEWFDENVVENVEELIEVGKITNVILKDKLNLGITSPKSTIAYYAIIFNCICEAIIEQEDKWDDFCVNVADRIKVGYTTTSSEDDEKSGNFMVFIQHVYNTSTDESLDEEEEDTVVLCTQWNAANVKAQTEIIKNIAARGKKAFKELINLPIETHELIIPLFCIIHSQLINYIRLKRVEQNKTEYELEIAGLFTVGIRETDEADEEVYFIPSVALKRLFKNDAIATGKHDE